jgi:flagellar assembly factor FliW
MPVTASEASVSSPSDVNASELVFSEGLVGCEDWKRFVLITDDEVELPIARLQSLDDPTVSFIITNPSIVEPTYAATLSSEQRAALELDDAMQPIVYCTLSVQSDGWLTANLLGPLVVNPMNRRAKQLVLNESSYSTKHPVARLASEDSGACSS